MPRLPLRMIADLGGAGGDVVDGVTAISVVAQHSLTASFVLWRHRAYVECLLQGPNKTLDEKLLPGLLVGSRRIRRQPSRSEDRTTLQNIPSGAADQSGDRR
jgi:hypothetical protein